MNLNKGTTAVESECLNRTLYYDMGQVQNYKYSVHYVGQMMLYLTTVAAAEHLQSIDPCTGITH